MKLKEFKKSFISIVVLLSMVLFFAGCNGETETSGADTDEVYQLSFAHVVRPTTPKGAAAEMFKEVIEERSEGRITVRVYPDSQMGNDQEINEQILRGTLDMNAPLLSTITSFAEEFELFDLPYLFTTHEGAYDALHGDVGEALNEYLEDNGFVGLGYWSGGFKQITNSVRPIETVEDMDGLRIRVSQSPLLVTQFRAVGAGGISVPFSELYSALQSGTVDGQDNPFSNIASRNFYEVQDYMTITDHGFMGYPFIMNKDTFNTLPSDLQDLVIEVAAEVTQWQWEEAQRADEKYLEEIIDSGMTISEFNEAEKANFRQATQAAYDSFLQKENGEELLNLVEQYTN
ncbi:C4-dicarboxylate-binding protein DctP [Natranaerovirga hydrolytica]|uniref:C4-dicarboxylate-binding protein DctP n=1 Tax=Natranaerovirga hydrolytica TaxID=680378 RepID=A0A4R1MZ80_9FIRM|nr:TRAP transporter substrate-binding protein [Natranaerovirga hydrolytica]TCK98638.1 C4-dicarboxylate-binding protein DctP [Natranaerovirga hydrolytica]